MSGRRRTNLEVRVFGEDRRSERTGGVEDNVFAALGLQRARRATPLSQLEGDLMFWPVRAVPGSFFESSYPLFRVGFKPRRRTENERYVAREAQSISLEPLQEIRCRGGVTLVIQSFRPQRPRASVSTGIRSGLVECEVKKDARHEDEEEENARRVPAGGIAT